MRPNRGTRSTGLKQRRLRYKMAQSEIKSYILRHALKAGDALPSEGELAQQLKISRNSVREAVKSLEAVGIVEAYPGYGLFVREFSFDAILENLPFGILFALKRISEVQEIRFHIEYGLAETLVASAKPAQIARLNEILERMRTDAEAGTYSLHVDWELHQALWENVENRTLHQLLDIFAAVLQKAREEAAVQNPKDPLYVYRCHAALVKALEQRDVKKMQAAIKRHYATVVDLMKRLAR